MFLTIVDIHFGKPEHLYISYSTISPVGFVSMTCLQKTMSFLQALHFTWMRLFLELIDEDSALLATPSQDDVALEEVLLGAQFLHFLAALAAGHLVTLQAPCLSPIPTIGSQPWVGVPEE